MVLRLLLTGAIFSCCELAATIDGGAILVAPYFLDVDFSALHLGSSDGNFIVNFSGGGGSFFGGDMPFVRVGPLSIRSYLQSSWPATGWGSIGGTFYPALSFHAPQSGRYTSIQLESSPFLVTGSGVYSVPFTMTGTIMGFVTPSDVVLNESVSGAGILSFRIDANPSGGVCCLLQIGSSLTYSFEAVPEPATALTAGIGVAMVWLARRRWACRRRHSS